MIGEIIGQQYEVTAMLGAGSMGEVYKGWDRSLGRHVAIKVLKPNVGSGTERFRTEAQILANLNHGNICSVFSLLEHQGRAVMVLQHLEGTPLDAVLTEQGSLPWSEVKAIADDVLSGLTEAHHAKVVHRDLKPANLMRVPAATGFKTVIMDFGIARAQGQARATREGMVACTIEYASPEQIQGEDVGPASDLYSLAMVLYELLTGDLAFAAKTDAAWAHAHVYETPDWSKVSALHGKAVVQFLRGAVEKKPQDRYLDAQAMLQALRQLPDGDGHQGDGVVARLVGSISQTLSNAKTQTRPNQPATTFKQKASSPKPQTSSPPKIPAAPAPGWAVKLQEHWAFLFLGVMVLIGLVFFGLGKTRSRGETLQSNPSLAAPSTSESTPNPVSAAATSPPATPPALRPVGTIVVPVPATGSLDLGAGPSTAASRSSESVEKTSAPVASSSPKQTTRSRPRVTTKIE